MPLASTVDNIRLIERSTLSNGHHWEVRRGFAAIGYVRKDHASGRYVFFIGLHNQQTIAYEADTLDQIRNKISDYG